MHPLRKFLCIMAVFVVVPFYPSLASDRPVQTGNASALPDFTIPAVLLPMLHDYRRDWTRVTALEPSALHWGQGIVLYMNQSSDISSTTMPGREKPSIRSKMRHTFPPRLLPTPLAPSC